MPPLFVITFAGDGLFQRVRWVGQRYAQAGSKSSQRPPGFGVRQSSAAFRSISSFALSYIADPKPVSWKVTSLHPSDHPPEPSSPNANSNSCLANARPRRRRPGRDGRPHRLCTKSPGARLYKPQHVQKYGDFRLVKSLMVKSGHFCAKPPQSPKSPQMPPKAT